MNVGEIIELSELYKVLYDCYIEPEELLELSCVDIDDNGRRYDICYEVDEIDKDSILDTTIIITAITLIE